MQYDCERQLGTNGKVLKVEFTLLLGMREE